MSYINPVSGLDHLFEIYQRKMEEANILPSDEKLTLQYQLADQFLPQVFIEIKKEPNLIFYRHGSRGDLIHYIIKVFYFPGLPNMLIKLKKFVDKEFPDNRKINTALWGLAGDEPYYYPRVPNLDLHDGRFDDPNAKIHLYKHNHPIFYLLFKALRDATRYYRLEQDPAGYQNRFTGLEALRLFLEFSYYQREIKFDKEIITAIVLYLINQPAPDDLLVQLGLYYLLIDFGYTNAYDDQEENKPVCQVLSSTYRLPKDRIDLEGDPDFVDPYITKYRSIFDQPLANGKYFKNLADGLKDSLPMILPLTLEAGPETFGRIVELGQICNELLLSMAKDTVVSRLKFYLSKQGMERYTEVISRITSLLTRQEDLEAAALLESLSTQDGERDTVLEAVASGLAYSGNYDMFVKK